MMDLRWSQLSKPSTSDDSVSRTTTDQHTPTSDHSNDHNNKNTVTMGPNTVSLASCLQPRCSCSSSNSSTVAGEAINSSSFLTANFTASFLQATTFSSERRRSGFFWTRNERSTNFCSRRCSSCNLLSSQLSTKHSSTTKLFCRYCRQPSRDCKTAAFRCLHNTAGTGSCDSRRRFQHPRSRRRRQKRSCFSSQKHCQNFPTLRRTSLLLTAAVYGLWLSMFLCVPLQTQGLLTRMVRFRDRDRGSQQRQDMITISQLLNFTEEDTNLPAYVATFVAYPNEVVSAGSLTEVEAVIFTLNKATDPKQHFSIGASDGILRIIKALDREEQDRYSLGIEARDRAGNIGYTTVTIFVDDINDNAPVLVPQNEPIVMENSPPGTFVTRVFGRDPDTPRHGPPFQFSGQTPENSELAKLFDIRFHQGLDNGNGGFEVYAKVTFDREHRKFYDLPVIAQDSGNPPNKQIRLLKIVIGDRNDSPMRNGAKTVTAYSFKGSLRGAPLGQVYVDDADDWDVPDKTFSWISDPGSGLFTIDKDTGIIYAQDAVVAGQYILEVKVTDNKRMETATGHVTVNVISVDEEAVSQLASLRLCGISPAKFVWQTKDGDSVMQKLRSKLAELLQIGADSVHVLSVMVASTECKQQQNGGAVQTDEPLIDVGYFVRDTNGAFRSPTALNGLVELWAKDISRAVGALVHDAGVNDCQDSSSSICVGGCSARLVAFDNSSALLDANATAFVGVTTASVVECGCPKSIMFPSFDSGRICTRRSCLNGGVCYNTGPSFLCDCRNQLLHGFRCEGLTRSFNENGYAWLPPLPGCGSLRISFQFITKRSHNSPEQPDAYMLLYSGPLNSNGPAKHARGNADFLSVLLIDGKLVVKARFRSEIVRLQLANQKSQTSLSSLQLNDGRWHQVDVVLRERGLELVVDKCRNAKRYPAYKSESVDLDSCRVVISNALSYEFLTSSSPVQLGGLARIGGARYPPELENVASFSGCIRELRLNGELMDLFNVPFESNSEFGCKASNCQAAASDGEYCANGECLADFAVTGKSTAKPVCVCDPGWRGDRCEFRNAPVTMNAKSFLRYSLDVSGRRRNAASVKILILPTKSSGTVLRAVNAYPHKFMSVQISDDEVSYSYDMGSGHRLLLIDGVKFLPNQTYWLHLERYNEYSRLSVDGLSGRFSKQSLDLNREFQIDLEPSKFYLGAESELALEDFEGCIADFRWDDQLLPLSESESPMSFARIVASSNVSPGCPHFPSCASLPNLCTAPFVCVDFWKGAFCACPPNMRSVLSSSGTLDSCRKDSEKLVVGITSGAIAAMLASIVLFCILVLFLLCFSRSYAVHQLPQEYEARETIVNYFEEGGGEEDQLAYDISPLRKPVLPMEGDSPLWQNVARSPQGRSEPTRPPKGGLNNGDTVGQLIEERCLAQTLASPALETDQLHRFAFEGEARYSGSVSSISSDSATFESELSAELYAQRGRDFYDTYATVS